MSVFLIVLVTAIWGYFKYDDIQFLAGGVFKIEDLPDSVEIIDRATWAWTDYREEYILFVSPEEFGELLKGRDYKPCITSATSKEVSAGLEQHEPFNVVACFRAGDFKKDGSVQIYTSLDNTALVVIYDAD